MKHRGFIMITPTIIFSIVFMMTILWIGMYAYTVQHAYVSLETKIQSAYSVDSCVQEFVYKLKQGTIMEQQHISRFWFDGWCFGSISDQNTSLKIDMTGAVFIGTSSSQAVISATTFLIESLEKF